MADFLSGLVQKKTKAVSYRIPRPVRRLAEIIALGSVLSSPAMAQSCFQGQIQSSHADNIAKSTVSLVSLNNFGSPLDYGTGFIIHDSEGKDGLKRIVTALHVSNGGLVEAYSSSGRKLGLMKSVINSGPLKNRTADADVLRFASLTKGTAGFLKDIRGLDIDPSQSATGILTGLFEHGAPLPGTSGAAAVGHDTGFVKGIMADYFTLASIPDVKRKGPHFYSFDQGRIWSYGKPDEDYTVKEKARWFAIALTSPRVLAALGKAGKMVTTSNVSAEAVDVAGFTSGYCMATSGTMKQLDPADPGDFDLETEAVKPAKRPRSLVSNNAYASGWDNSAAAIQKVKSVLAEAQKASPHNAQLSATRTALNGISDIAKLPLASNWQSQQCQQVSTVSLGMCRPSVGQVMEVLSDAAQNSPSADVRNHLNTTLANLPFGYIRASWFTGTLNARLSR